ncbi:ABC transporter ATP-binding protein [Corynebacterium sp. MC-17D]|uniref:ABC transporter ATP-binding protein n=1 Tax=Corynebacterium lipophilum TaxID=2804918 RepID=A0AAW5HVE6_9CORY|nr:ABC transporter ATP-binding protein [Corynebacterium lipophilum]MCO6394762.1 ABC transporter ATP-binding protein [Corynebacterium lipophilum]MCZ2117333.1 ABC transporter ATP-binding protein [Corynebacterium lipophilum]
MLEVKNLETGFPGTTILSGISFELDAPSVIGLVGPNGCGKSTLLKSIAGVHPFTGDVLFDGKPLRDYPRTERVHVLSYVAQHSGDKIPLTVREVIQLGRSAGRGSFAQAQPEDEEIILHALRHADLEGIVDQKMSELSGGQIQRAMVARAMAQRSKVMLLDEPTNHLDLHHQYKLMNMLRHLSREHNTVIVLAIHDLALAARYCDRLLLLHDKQLKGNGAPDDVLTPAVLENVFGVSGNLDRDSQDIPVLHISHPV